MQNADNCSENIMPEIPLEDRSILVTGGSKTIGLAVVIDLHSAGSQVIIGTRSRENYHQVLAAIQTQNPNFDGERVYPFLADITSPDQIDAALSQLKGKDVRVTDIVLAAAGGMDSFKVPLTLSMARLGRYSPEEREQGYVGFRAKEEKWVREAQKGADAVNYTGSRYLTERLRSDLPRRGVVVFLSSLWTSFREQVWVPRFYDGPVASVKKRFEDWLERESGLEKQRIYTAIVSGNAVLETPTGDFMSRMMVPLLPKADQDRIRTTFIGRGDMVRATRMALDGEGFEQADYHRRLFVFGPNGQISRDPQAAMAVLGLQLPI